MTCFRFCDFVGGGLRVKSKWTWAEKSTIPRKKKALGEAPGEAAGGEENPSRVDFVGGTSVKKGGV